MACADDWIVKAIVASEDKSFFTHRGVRPLSMLRALWQNIVSGRRISGASTLTMQTVRLIRPHEKTYVAKWIEAFHALDMERKRDKLWILSQYLNRAPFGACFIGIEAACEGWFGKSAKALTLTEAALLAGMVQAPSRFRPDRGYERAIKRRDYVLDRMVDLGFATPEQALAAREIRPKVNSVHRPFAHPHYCDSFIAGHLGDGRKCGPGDYTTPLDPAIQALCSSIISSAAADKGYSSAAVVRRVDSGDVVALAVSGDYFSSDAGQVNTACSYRSAGSTLKPLLAALAMDMGVVSPGEMLPDVPRSYKGYSPVNFDGKWRALVSIDDALVLSLNMPFVFLLERAGVGRFSDSLRSLGFSKIKDSVRTLGLGMAIGNVEISLLELTKAYRRFAYAALGGRDAIISSQSAYLVSEMLSKDERSLSSLGHFADVQAPRFAWKTGTSSAHRDAWTVAWNSEYVVGVWCGHIAGSGDKSIVGAKAASPLAWRIARSLYPGAQGPWFSRADGISERKVCVLSGLTAGQDCKNCKMVPYIKLSASAELCPVHVRDFSGNVVERISPMMEAFLGRIDKARSLAILQPVDGTEFKLVSGMSNQKIVCKVAGNPAGENLWWFCDSRLMGESEGSAPFAMEMTRGEHIISCSTAQGVAAEVRVKVE